MEAVRTVVNAGVLAPIFDLPWQSKICKLRLLFRL